MSRLHPAGVAGFALGVGALIGAAAEVLRPRGSDHWQSRALYWQARATELEEGRDVWRDAATLESWDLQHWQQRAEKAERAEAELVEVLARKAEEERPELREGLTIQGDPGLAVRRAFAKRSDPVLGA